MSDANRTVTWPPLEDDEGFIGKDDMYSQHQRPRLANLEIKKPRNSTVNHKMPELKNVYSKMIKKFYQESKKLE